MENMRKIIHPAKNYNDNVCVCVYVFVVHICGGCYVRAAWAAGSGDTVEAWRTQMVVVQAVARFMQECKEENWMLPVMYTSCLDLR